MPAYACLLRCVGASLSCSLLGMSLAMFALSPPATAQDAPNVVWVDAGSGPFFNVAYSVDGRFLFTAGRGSVKVWDAETGRFIRTLGSHGDNVYALSVSSDGQRVFSGGGDNGLFPNDHRIRVWRTADWTLERILQGNWYVVGSIVSSHDGSAIMASGFDDFYGNREIVSYRVPTNIPIAQQFYEGCAFNPQDLALLPDGEHAVAMAGDTPAIVRLDGTIVRPIQVPFSCYSTLDVSPDGGLLAVNGAPFHVLDISQEDAPVIFTPPQDLGSVVSLRFSPEGSRLAASYRHSGDANALRLFDTSDWSLAHTIPLGVQGVGNTAFSPDGLRIAAVAGERVQTGYRGHRGIRNYRTADASEVYRIAGPLAETVWSVKISPDGRMVGASTFIHSRVTLWNASDGTIMSVIEDDNQGSLIFDFSPDSRYIAVIPECCEGPIRIRRVEDGAVVRELGVGVPATSLVYSPDGQLIATGGGGDSSVIVVDVESGEVVRTFSAYGERPVVFSRDGTLLALQDSFESVQIWRTADWTLMHTVSGINGRLADFAPDGSLVAVIGTVARITAARVWRVSDAQLVGTFRPGEAAPSVAAFLPDSQSIMAVGGGVASFWRIADGQQLDKIDREMAPSVLSIDLSTNGRYFAIGRFDATVVMARNPIACAADFNDDGAADSSDLTAFLESFFASHRSADVNFDGVLNSQDFFDFLTLFFAGC